MDSESEFDQRVQFVKSSQQALASQIDQVSQDIKALKESDEVILETDELLRKSAHVWKRLQDTVEKYEKIQNFIDELKQKENEA